MLFPRGETPHAVAFRVQPLRFQQVARNPLHLVPGGDPQGLPTRDQQGDLVGLRQQRINPLGPDRKAAPFPRYPQGAILSGLWLFCVARPRRFALLEFGRRVAQFPAGTGAGRTSSAM